MLKTLVLAGVLLLACAFFFAPTVSAGASQTDEFVIPLDEYLHFSNNLTVHLIQVTISNITYYTTFSPDPVNTVWPILVFQYENHGNYQVACRFHVQIVDNTSKVPAGWTYDKTDETIYKPLYPNQNSSIMTMEYAMPKNRVLTNLSIIDDGLKKEIANIPIVYPTPAPLPTPGNGSGLFEDGNGDSLRNLLLIPLLLGIVGLIGWFMARKRLF
jgi:hypothetical protein